MPSDRLTETCVHPSAVIDPSATLGEGVAIGPGVVIGPHCVIGDRTRLGPHVVIVNNTTIGCDNDIHAGAILGDDPQDHAFDPKRDEAQLFIGDRNIIREYVTFHRGAGEAGPTRIGSDGFFMAYTHIAHNCVVGDRVILINYAGLAGHVRLGEGCLVSASVKIHQFCVVGEHALFQGGASVSQHVPPFTIVHRDSNRLAGINVVGLRRSKNFSRDDITELREVYRLLLRSSDPWPVKLERVGQRNWRPPSARLISFVEDALAMEPPRAKGVCAGVVRRVRARAKEA